MAVQALTFDIIGTVFDWLGSFATGVVPLAQQYGLSIGRPNAPMMYFRK